MNRSRRPLQLKCLTAAVAVALLAVPTVQAAAATSHPVVHSVTVQHVEPNQVQPSGKSYFWSDVAIGAGVLAGIVVLGLWGDVAIGGLIVGIQLLCASAALGARKVAAHARKAPRWSPVVGRDRPATWY
jgi:hypothetical protein